MNKQTNKQTNIFGLAALRPFRLLRPVMAFKSQFTPPRQTRQNCLVCVASAPAL